jgi:methionine-gamma-lyase
MNSPKIRLTTLAVHAGRSDLRALGVHAPPLDLSATYPLGDLGEARATLDRWSEGVRDAGNPIYTRVFNQTVGRFEEAVAALEGTDDAVAFASGMAAFSAVLLALGGRGGHVVALRPLYGTTDHLLTTRLLGLDLSWASAEEVASALRPDTVAVILETPQNPTLALVDIAQVVAQAGSVPVLVDNTFATPVLQNPAAQGAAFVLHSATKYLGGHGDAAGGIVATDAAQAATLRRVRFATGGILHPLAAYLLHRGVPTLPLRVEAAQATAKRVVASLERHPAVERVLYPSLDPRAPRLLGTQMRGPGAMLAIDLGSEQRARQVLRLLRLATHAVSLGSVDTLVEHPASLTHRIVDGDGLAQGGVTPGLIRFSVGLEHPDDLANDIVSSIEDAAGADSRGRTHDASVATR